MSIVLYRDRYDLGEALDNFQTAFYTSRMNYFASDLLDQGLSPKDIIDAVKRAMRVGKASGMNIRQHFTPLYTQRADCLVKDCKLSKLGYAMVLLNARPELAVVGEWQLRVLTEYFE